MKVLYFDCFSGISGDMALGALLDLGVDKDLFRSELDKLNIGGYDIIIEKKMKNGITGTDVQVIVNEEFGKVQEKLRQYENIDHVHTHVQEGYKQEIHKHEHLMRNLENIEELIDSSDLSCSIKDFSKKVFREIARAEAKVHYKDIHNVHFHEVGAIDSIIDIVGTAICLESLGVRKVFSSPLHDGHGFIECRHGILPVPVPAVMEMLTDSKIPYISEDINTELVTPTGIGIIKCLASDFGNMPAMIVDRIGYGMGKREVGRLNALRVVMGTLFGEDDMMEEIAVLETNIDNMNSEILSYTMENLLENGALDVFFTPIYMKKNRPAVIMTVLTGKESEKKMIDIILNETTTLGIRSTKTKRYCMDREIVKINTEYGDVRVKVASKGDMKKLAPEYEDCREIAKRTGMSLIKVYNMVNEKLHELM